MASSENGKTAANQRDHSHHCIPSTARAVTPPKVGVISDVTCIILAFTWEMLRKTMRYLSPESKNVSGVLHDQQKHPAFTWELLRKIMTILNSWRPNTYQACYRSTKTLYWRCTCASTNQIRCTFSAKLSQNQSKHIIRNYRTAQCQFSPHTQGNSEISQIRVPLHYTQHVYVCFTWSSLLSTLASTARCTTHQVRNNFT